MHQIKSLVFSIKMTFASVSNMAAKEIMLVMNSEALSLQWVLFEQKDISYNDVFTVLPTDFGKSLCHTFLPGIFDKVFGSTNSMVIATFAR